MQLRSNTNVVQVKKEITVPPASFNAVVSSQTLQRAEAVAQFAPWWTVRGLFTKNITVFF